MTSHKDDITEPRYESYVILEIHNGNKLYLNEKEREGEKEKEIKERGEKGRERGRE